MCVAVAKITAEYELVDLVLLDEPQNRPRIITENFWRGWEKYKKPTFVTFNGQGLRLPLVELSAFRYGVSVPAWFMSGKLRSTA